MNNGHRFFNRAYKASGGFQSFNRMSQSAQMNMMTLKVAQSTMYANTLRFNSTLLIPLNARLALANDSELDDDLTTSENVTEDVEDDTLAGSSVPSNSLEPSSKKSANS